MSRASIKAYKGSEFKQPPVGQAVGICYQVIALGNQAFRNSVTPRVWIGFELPEHAIETPNGKKPMTIGKEYALFLGGKSKLGEMLKTWRGKPFTDKELEAFEVTSIAGKIGNVAIGPRESDSTKREITLVLGLIKQQREAIEKGEIAKDPVNEIVVYSPDDHDDAMWAKVPEFLKRKINERVVEKDSVETPPATDQDFDDDIPF